MKRILTLLGVLLTVCTVAFAQRTTYFAEDFNIGNSGSHTIGTYWDQDSSQMFLRYLYAYNGAEAGGTKPEALIGYYPDLGLEDILNGTFRLVSKPFETKGGSTYITMKYRYMADRLSLKNNRNFSVLARQGTGEWTTCATIDSLPAQIPASVLCARLPEAFEKAEDIQIALQLYSTKDGRKFAFFLDDVTAFSMPADWFAADVTLLSSVNVSGALDTLDLNLKNVGNAVNASCTVSYRWDEGEIYTATYGVAKPLDVDQAVDIRLMPQGWQADTYGAHVFEVWISAIDGKALAEAAVQKQTYTFYNVNDADLFAKKILIEEFTSASCGPCASWNQSVFNPTFDSLGLDVVLIKYQMNWPGSGDRYYTRDGGARRNYYGVTGVPTMVLEGRQISPASDASRFLAYLRDRMASAGKAFFNIVFDTLVADSTNKSLQINYKLTTKGSLSNAKLQTVVLERETTGNKGGNGESSFHHVMMAMTPGVGADGNTGLTVNLKADSVYEFRYTVNLKNTHVEEYHDLLVACFIQAEDGTVIQSVIQEVVCSSAGVDNEAAVDYAPLAIYPNPASEQVYLQGLSSAEVEVWDMAGRRLFVRSGISGDYVLDVRPYRPGLYVVKVREANKVSMARLSVVR